jgi:hypothetical protein
MDEKKVMRVLHGFIELNDQEKTRFVTEINKYYKGGYEKTLLIERLETFSQNLGPTSDASCVCCGRG